MTDIFCLRQLPLKYMDYTWQMAYLGHEWYHIQCDQGLLHLAKQNLELEEAVIKECLRSARVFLQITPHLDDDHEPGKVPARLHYPRITNRGAQYKYNIQSTARLARERQGGHSYQVARAAWGSRHKRPCIYCNSWQHLSEECMRPHVRCTGEECKVSPLHMHYKPCHSLCPYFVLHTSGDCMDPQEEAYALEDILYLNDYENRTD